MSAPSWDFSEVALKDGRHCVVVFETDPETGKQTKTAVAMMVEVEPDRPFGESLTSVGKLWDNTRLVVAAPDLLEALEGLLADLGSEVPSLLARERAEAAVAKARKGYSDRKVQNAG